MRKLLIINLLSMVLLYGEPYKPYPVILIHGISGSSKDFGVELAENPPDQNPRSEWIEPNKILSGYPYKRLLNLALPYCYVWDELENSFTVPGDSTPEEGFYPNKSFIEIFNADDAYGSIDPDSNPDAEYPEWPYYYPYPHKGIGDELRDYIGRVLEEYYGIDWRNNPDAKVILVAHSLGGLVVREALREDPGLIPHIAKVITLNSPHSGTGISLPFVRTYMTTSLIWWHPYLVPISYLVEEGLDWLYENVISQGIEWFTEKLEEIGFRFTFAGDANYISEQILDRMDFILNIAPWMREIMVPFAVLEGYLPRSGIVNFIPDPIKSLFRNTGATPDATEGFPFFEECWYVWGWSDSVCECYGSGFL